MDRPSRYRSFLLTVWEERSQDTEHPVVWRFGLEDVHALGRRRVFATMEEVMLFVRQEIERQSNTSILDDDKDE